MSILATNPFDQISGSQGNQQHVSWADLLDSVCNDVETGLEMKSLSEALNGIEADAEKQGEEALPKVSDTESTPTTAGLDKALPAMLLADNTDKESVASSSYSSASSSSSTSSNEELPSSLEPRPRHCIGVGVYSLCETLKLVKVGRVERPQIYYHARDENGEYLDKPIPVDAVGDMTHSSRMSSSSSSSIRRETPVKYSSPMAAALGGRPFQPRASSNNGTPSRGGGGGESRSPWHDPSTYRPVESSHHQKEQYQPNFAPFYSKQRRQAAQRAQMRTQMHQNPNQTRMRNDSEQWQGCGHAQSPSPSPSQWQRQGHHQQPYQTRQPVEVHQRYSLPPRASLYGLLPAQNYDEPAQSHDLPGPRYERGGSQGQYDPAPHQAHWRDNIHERSKTPLTWASGRSLEPGACRDEDCYPPYSAVSEPRPVPDRWRKDVDMMKRGIFNRTHN